MARLGFVLAVLLLSALGGAAWAGDPGPGPQDAAAIRAVISDQLGAFRRDDGTAAFADASPAIQGIFGDPETFMRMVRTAYQPVYRASGVEFRGLAVVGGRLIQQVYMVGPDGVAVLADYEMQRQPDGSWRINGCSIARAPDQGV
ncbi:MAG TPA: DUF4864 domain-containing protein [Dongiaceae bacterium]|nr:DUF4864 domain-containing protein [Dongiaceae bacterium]